MEQGVLKGMAVYWKDANQAVLSIDIDNSWDSYEKFDNYLYIVNIGATFFINLREVRYIRYRVDN